MLNEGGDIAELIKGCHQAGDLQEQKELPFLKEGEEGFEIHFVS